MPAHKAFEVGYGTDRHASGEVPPTVKATLTCGRCSHSTYDHTPRCGVGGCKCAQWRRTKPVTQPRETMDYLSAARRFIRAAGRRAGDGDEYELAGLIALSDDLREAIREAVRGQRAHGKSWAAIARATGTTREAAFQRWRDQ